MMLEIEETTPSVLADARKPRPYDQLAGEPNLWYDRFIKFCLYGPTRTIHKCYRDVMAERDASMRIALPKSNDIDPAGRVFKGLARPRRKSLPKPWIRRVKQFGWWGRAAAWDAARAEIANQRSEEATHRVCEVSPEMVQILIDMARGEVRGNNGEITEGISPQQRRMAATTLIKFAGVVYDGPQGDEDDGEVEVIGIRINRVGD